jgi:hypothetical protein
MLSDWFLGPGQEDGEPAFAFIIEAVNDVALTSSMT